MVRLQHTILYSHGLIASLLQHLIKNKWKNECLTIVDSAEKISIMDLAHNYLVTTLTEYFLNNYPRIFIPIL